MFELRGWLACCCSTYWSLSRVLSLVRPMNSHSSWKRIFMKIRDDDVVSSSFKCIHCSTWYNNHHIMYNKWHFAEFPQHKQGFTMQVRWQPSLVLSMYSMFSNACTLPLHQSMISLAFFMICIPLYWSSSLFSPSFFCPSSKHDSSITTYHLL